MSNRVLIPLELTEPPALPPGAHAVHLGGATMGTTWSVQALLPSHMTSAAVEVGVQTLLDRVIRQMSTWAPDSDLSRFNQAGAGSWHRLPDDFFTVLDAALTMAFDSNGAFDPTIGPVVNLWGFGPDHERSGDFGVMPESEVLEATRARCGWQRLELDRSGQRVLQPGGAYLDFSGIAKGYAVDLIARYLRQAGCVSFLVEVGGELSGFGAKADGQPWWVALEQPAPSGADAQTILAALHGLSVATSGDYRRYFDRDGQRYAHTIDPRTGRPVAHAPASVTVLHPRCMVADALATVLSVLGEEAGLAFARERNVAARFLRATRSGYAESMTPAFAAMLDEGEGA